MSPKKYLFSIQLREKDAISSVQSKCQQQLMIDPFTRRQNFSLLQIKNICRWQFQCGSTGVIFPFYGI